ncbi:hypothetical protein [uncultured Lutibacter sp.]|uniref:hypothetical protein n=1 Tax=uncultured Lutibacter sp. TaxID=437739 RepID=UPI00261A3C3E|nr:hypothetical protein [uncultured Lutibacter sp.]
MNYLNILKSIYQPEVGSIWKAPNNIWTSNFAKNKNPKDFHPSIVSKVKQDNVSVQLAPGTTKEYQKGSCVFKIDLKVNGKTSYFLLKLSMPFIIDDLLSLDRGWSGIDSLSEKQLQDFEWQNKMCKG